ncbi:peptidoglycan-binding protein [Streptomyces libani]|uniref:helix-turn-helix domain-containing protein n=1 Tax=Streptomyces nigrescens TaxID=1920 RepID=UPI00224C98DE|nr:helix-turn-helix domain-containing protein [Streptomyces libani]MCX5448705.1 peptidoglycan-binding protein [Streptomyces libani]
MSRWSGLPASLDHRVRQLVVQLRRLKDHSGLSLVALAARTSYSKSSWERYLNGKKLPPAGAVEALGRLCGADVPRLLALHEVAAQAWSAGRPTPEARPREVRLPEARPPLPQDRSGPLPRAAGDGAPVPTVSGAGRRVPLGSLVLGALAVLVVAGVALPALRPWQGHSGAWRGAGAALAGPAPGAAPEFTHRPGEVFGCRVQRRGGVLYAGHSRTDTEVLGSGAEGWAVVEAQCLLHHQGYDPGAVDGIVRGRTRRAVQRLQAGSGLPTDGTVGPATWKALRG